jgi:hypothetical protein
MMGKQQRTESLFYYFRLEDQIPNDYLLRLIDQHIDFPFVPELLRNFYSSTGLTIFHASFSAEVPAFYFLARLR